MEINKDLEQFMRQCFETTILSLREVQKQVYQFFSINLTLKEIVNIWKDLFSLEAYYERKKKVKHLSVANNWGKRNVEEKKATILKAITAARNSRQQTKKEVEKISNNLLQLSNNEILKHVENLKLDFELKLESEDYIQCLLCGETSTQLMGHLVHQHNITSKVYKKLFPKSSLICQQSVLKHATSIRINTRSIRFDVDIVDIKLESKFNLNRLKQYEKTIERDVACQDCGTETSLFDVHHIVPQRLFTRYDIEQDDLDNLILLCKHCHSTLGQKLDDIILNIFETIIKFKFPSCYESIIKILKQSEKSFLKRRPGAPSKYYVSKKDLELFVENSIVDIRKASESLKIPTWVIKRFCRSFRLTFDCVYESETKILKTKFCPCCSWSGAFKFTKHLLTTNDDNHKKFLEEFKEKYFELKSAQSVAEFYEKYNFTKAITKELLDSLSVLKKLDCKNYKCPVCYNELRYIIKHLNDEKDLQHVSFCKMLKDKYFIENKSMTFIAKELELEENIVIGYLKQFY